MLSEAEAMDLLDRAKPKGLYPNRAMEVLYPCASALFLGRAALGYSQREVEARSGVDSTLVCRFERGELVPGMRALQALSDALQMPYRSLAKLAIRQALREKRLVLERRYGVPMEDS